MQIKQNYFGFRSALNNGEYQKAEEYFQKAFDEAFGLYRNKLSNNEKFDLNNENELFAVVVLFDNMIGFWKEGMTEEGIAFAESMVDLLDSDKLKEMFKGYALGMENGIDLDSFMREYVDLGKVDKEFPQFLCNFTERITELIK
jgi:tetratricopeptide (TPR) repeat protein